MDLDIKDLKEVEKRFPNYLDGMMSVVVSLKSTLEMIEKAILESKK